MSRTLSLALMCLWLGLALGCKKKDGPAPNPDAAPADPNPAPANPSDKKAPDAPKVKLPTKEELKEKLKGKNYEQVKEVLGKPDREYGTQSDAGRLVYDRKIARDAKAGKDVGGTVWFARGVVDSIQYH